MGAPHIKHDSLRDQSQKGSVVLPVGEKDANEEELSTGH